MSASVPLRSRSSSDLQNGSACKGDDLRDVKQQAADTCDELQRIREDRDQLRIALDSALSQTQQLGALQSEVSMLKGQLEETLQSDSPTDGTHSVCRSLSLGLNTTRCVHLEDSQSAGHPRSTAVIAPIVSPMIGTVVVCCK